MKSQILTVRCNVFGEAAWNLKLITFGSEVHELLGSINPFTPKSDQFQISLAASPEILHHTV